MKKLKLFFALFAMLALNVGNAWGAEIVFKTNTSDATSALTTSNLKNQVTSGADYIASVGSDLAKVYQGKSGLKFGSLSTAGVLTLNLASAAQITNPTITIKSAKYNNKAGSFEIFVNGSTSATATATAGADLTFTYTGTITKIQFESKKPTSGDIRAYLSSINIVGGSTEETVYSVTLNQPANGTISAEGLTDGKAAEGVVVKLTATPNAGYNFDAWDVKDASSNAVSVDANGKFTMPASNVTVSASFVAKNQYSVAWKVNSEEADGGSTSATEGDKVAALPNTPDDCSGDVVFVGWSDQEVSDGNKPALLFTDLAGSPEITGNTTFYAVFAQRTITTGGTPESVTNTYTFSNYTAGTQYADNEKHVLDDILTLYTTDCHFTSELRIYSSSTYDGYVISNQLPGKIVSLDFNAGNKIDVIVVFGSTDGSTWTTVGEVSITSTSYKDYSLSFGESSYTYFKLDVEGTNQVRLKSLTLTYQSGNGTSVDYSDYSTSCTVEQDYTITIADDIEHGTITAPATAKAGATITLTATADENYSFDTWSVTEEGGTAVTVSGNQFTMPEANVTVSATFDENPKWTITWKSVEGSTTTEVYQGKSLGTIAEANDCPDGKVFMGWTATNEVNPNGLDIAYAKATDIPTDHTTYNAVYAAEGDVADIVDELTQAWTSISGTNYSSWSDKKSKSPAVYAGNSAGGNNSIQLRSNNSNSGIVTTTSGGKAKKIVVTWFTGDGGTSSGRTLDVYGKNSAYSAATDLYDNGKKGTLIGTIVCGTSTELEITDEYEYIGLRSNSGAMYLSEIKITWSSTSYSHYSFDCEVVNDPYLNVDPTTITFDATNVGFNSTKNIDITAGYLTEDITLAISGANANEFSVSTAKITKDEEVSQEVTVTYAPTVAGSHSATLNITSGSTLSKAIALTGSAEEATIYTLTDLANINPKDKVIIVGTSGGNTYAMSNDKGTDDAPDAVQVTVADNKIATNAENILWNIAKNGDNLTIYPADQTKKWLYCLADANDGVRVGTGNAKEFTIDKGYLYTTQTTSARHIGIYNNADWRCYKPSGDAIHTNIAGQTFAFYVLPNTDPSIDVNPESHDFVVALNGSASKEVEITAHNIATPTYSVSISDDTHFTASVNAGKVTITYAPTTIGEHTATLTITETTSSQTATVELTGKCVETMDVADAMATADNTEVALNPFEVVKVISNKNYVYIKDATGASMIFDDDNAHSMGSLVEGATVTGFVGRKGAYYKNPQLTPSVDYSALSVSGSGTAEATEITELKAEDVNKFVVLKGVEITSNVNISENPTFTVNGNNVVSYNQFGRNFDFQASMLYDIYGFVGIFNETVQFWFLQATSAGSAIEYYTVNYESGASDVTGNVPVDTKEYAEGESVTLKTCELTREGYTFAGWDVTSTSGSVEVADNKFIMPASDVTVTALWKEIKTYDQGAWVLVTDASDLAVNDDVIIAAANDNYALGTKQNSNNRGTVTITKGNNVVFLESNVQILTLENGKQSGTLALSTGNGYLYAASSEKNYLRTETSLSGNSSWTIEINEGVATIKAQGDNTRNLLQYNSNDNLFSCYSSNQKPVAIYEYHPNERVITFDVNGGEAYAHTYVATTDGVLALPTEVPTHAAEGQLFDSWNDKQDGSGHKYNAGDIFSFSEHTVLYAQWTVANAYHVTYNIAGASGTTPVDLTHYYGGETVTLALQGDLVNPGHIFAGWKVVDATDTEIMVTDNAFIMPQSDVTATAKWVRQTNDQWVLVTDAAQLVVGEKYVIACNTQYAVAGNINTTFMSKLDAAFSNDKQLIKALSPDAIVLTLGGTTDAWTFTNESGKALGATAAKKMAWGDGTTTWTLTFDANGALTMKNATDANGSLQYNSQNPRFTTYVSGQKDIQLYILNPAQVVEGDKTDNDVPQYSNVTVEDGGDLSVENTDTQYGDMYINNGGSVEVDDNAQLTVNNLYIQTTMGTTTSGQLNTAPENLIVNGDAFIDITLGKNGDPSQWHAFTVPFPVDAMNGVYDLNDNQLKNEVNYAIMDYHGDVRAQGKYGWKKYSGVLVPGTFYLMTVDGARTTYRFKKVKDAALVAENIKSLSAYTGGGKNTDHGWNGVGNPTLMHGTVAFAAQILDPISYTYQVIEASSAHFTVGTPFFIQAATDGEVTINAEGNGTLAPARRAATTVEKIKVMLGNADYTDHLYVSASEDATNDYEIGKDLVKMVMTNTPIVPQIFAEAYGARLCMVNAPMTSNEATIALNLYAPAEGEYTLSVEEQADATVYLLYNGNIVWNLSMSEYPIQLSQGDNAGYSLVVRRENAPTDVENILGADEQTEKFIYNGKLYILHEGKVFDAVGNVLK